MSSTVLIDFILKNKPIVKYLEQRDIQPVKRLTGGKLSYLCPLPSHKESKPSFVVFTNGQYENFYCFGCHAGTTIIQLVSALENISIKESIVKLSEGAEITPEIESELYYKHAYEEKSVPYLEELSNMRFLSDICRSYLDGVNHDRTEVEIVDKFWNKVDGWIANYEFEELKNIHQFLPLFLQKRREKYYKAKECEEIKRMIKC